MPERLPFFMLGYYNHGMNKQILLNGKQYSFSFDALPLLIHGADHSGASLFTVSVMTDLWAQGAKLLFLSGYHMARDEFLLQTEDGDNSMLIESEYGIEQCDGKRTIFVKRENADWFIRLAQTLPDIDERIILIKNIDLFSAEVYNAVKDKQLLVLSGDIDRCTYMNDLLGRHFSSTVLFSQPSSAFPYTLSSVPRYHGYLWNTDAEGEVSLKM